MKRRQQLGAAIFLALSLGAIAFDWTSTAARTLDGGTDSQVALASENDIVAFNTRSKKYHNPSCSAARKSNNCINIKRSEARKRGGVKCKLCNAGE